MILHDLGLRFNSPFVNLWISPSDFIKMLGRLNYYMSCELVFEERNEMPYPVGLVDDIHIYFQHYKSEAEAKYMWDKRKKRINYNDLFVLFTDRDGCTSQNLIDFDSLPFKNKVCFVNKPAPSIKSAVYIRGFENETSVGRCMDYKSKFSCKKYYDDFNYVKWFNSSLENDI